MPSPHSLAERCLNIELLVLDVDGVLTDGSIVYADNGVELKAFHVRDGSALKTWQQLGKRTIILSGRNSSVVERRAAEVGVTRVLQGIHDKFAAFQDLLAAEAVRPDQVCGVGDDLPDLPVLRNCGLAIAVADACMEVKESAHYVTRAQGGRGSVREVIELILRAQGHWQTHIGRLRGLHLS